jgi:crossover junction endodeoxyribonuclease RusA
VTVIRLPWPPKELNPNNRTDRRRATPHRKAYREAGFFAAKEARAVITADAELRIKFFPPDAMRRDLDNMLASIKVGLDGIAKAAGVDDYGWTLTIERSAPVKGGAVLVQVAPRDGWRSIGAIASDMIEGQIK